MTDEELTAFLRDLPFLRAAEAADRIEALTATLTNLVEKSNAMLDAFCVLETQRQVEAYDSMCATLAEIENSEAVTLGEKT
jgi:hypothetical protein